MADSINVATGFDEKLLMELFTTDISAEECIYDLIDNSIDAAREEIQAGKYQPDNFGLPSSYDGYELNLTITNETISISDNCKGVSKEEFQKSAFVIGHRKTSDYGIGFYGIGLKRALLKLGNSYKVTSDDGSDKILFAADRASLSSRKEKTTADVLQTDGNHSFEIEITELSSEVKDVFSNKRWVEEIQKKIARRYAIFIGKGLKIKVGKTSIKGVVPSLRQRGPVAPVNDQIESVQGVDIRISTGMHSKYRMSYEAGYSLAKNKTLTAEFGWYVVCNDRIMIVGNKTQDIGLTSNWHSEYGGFVGLVYFVAKDGSDLPWNTKKTEVVTEHAAYMAVKDLLQEYTDDWKTRNRNARPKKKKTKSKAKVTKKGPSITQGGKGGASGGSGTSTSQTTPAPKSKPAKPEKLIRLDYHQDIFDGLKQLSNKKLISLYYSMCEIEVEDHTPILAVGVWAFLETLSKLTGRSAGVAFDAFWTQQWSKTHSLPGSASKKDYAGTLGALQRLSKAGNDTKHHITAATFDSKQLNNDLSVIKDIILKSIELSIANK